MEHPTLTKTLSRYVADAAERELPDAVVHKAKLHILDTLAAVISGSALAAGREGGKLAHVLGGPQESLVIGTGELVGATSAALANGMAAHADETDDSHAPSLSHPGCAVVPAALAAAERRAATGTAMIRAVVAGYDVGCRVGRSLGRDAVDLRHSRPSSHALVGTFGAATAAAVLDRHDQLGCEYVLSYAAQQAGGVTTWLRDVDHVEKAFVFGGSPARSGVFASAVVSSGCTGVRDVFEGHPNYLDAVSSAPTPALLTDELGDRFEICLTNIKRYCVGSPAQAAVQAAEELAQAIRVDHHQITGIDIALPADLAEVVNARGMPDVNVQYLVAGTLLDGTCTFAMAHDSARMQAPDLLRLQELTRLIPDQGTAGTRSAQVAVTLADGTVHHREVSHVRGTAENPMSAEEVRTKAIDVMSPVLGALRALQVAGALENLDEVADVRQLRQVLSVAR